MADARAPASARAAALTKARGGARLSIRPEIFSLSRACVALASLRNTKALEYLGKSNEIQRARELASRKTQSLLLVAIESLPESDDEDVQRSRRALVDITHRVITRNK
ncbi:hypothetical protein Syun_027628 [Stephania yunnanensis]|uniref:Uncharacterized protein n=1 Tax=Stephania yunnanensis TaxID=152371 RepID=A0AAP0EL15_9MAGN